MTGAALPAGRDPVALFEAHRTELARSKRATTLLGLAAFAVCVALSVSVAGFYPARLVEGVPRIFEYFATITPNLQWDVLFEGRNEAGRAVPGSLTYWYTDLDTYLTLIFETVLMAVSATILGVIGALSLCFAASQNLAPSRGVYFVARRLMEIARGVPEILLALVFVFMVGIGPLAGVLAIAIHSAGALGKLFAEVNENAAPGPVDGVKASGGNWFEQMRYGVLPQVTPNFVSYALLRFEINVRASSVVGFVGAGGIGQELNRTISFYSDDRVMAVLILVVLLVTAIDLISERLRTGFIGREAH
jgi:phosphonate transport system permease protein